MVRAGAAIIALGLLAATILASHQRKPFPLLIDASPASMIVCNPQPTPELVRWQKSKVTNT